MAQTIKQWLESDRPREELLDKGVETNFRTVISRVYYAAHLLAVRRLMKKGLGADKKRG
jgi:hypothetical protein